MIPTVVIGFGHKARHGKDTACNTIIRERCFKFDIQKMSFAKALKDEVIAMGNQRTLCEMVGRPYDENPPIDDPDCPPPHGKQRSLLQWWGTEFRRSQDPNYWTKLVERQIKSLNPQVVVISDMRFMNEFQMVKEQFTGYTVRMDRPGFEYGTATDHVSEIALDDAKYDFVISAQDRDELQLDVLIIFDNIMKHYYPDF